MNDKVTDLAFGAVGVGSFVYWMNILSLIAAILTVLYFAVRLWETKTVQCIVERIRGDDE